MKSFVLLLCLVQLWGCHSTPVALGLEYRDPACDDPETEEAALAGVDYINQHVGWGYKHILNQIDKVRVWSRPPLGELYQLEFDTLETTCHALDPRPLANCSVRTLLEHAVEGDCDMHVLKENGQFSVVLAKCESTPDSREDVHKVCPDCPLLAPVNDTKVVHAAHVALAAFNAQNNGSHFELLEISRAQLVSLPVSTYVEFAVVATDCVAADGTDSVCIGPAKKQYGFCKATLAEKLGGEEVSVTCTVFQTQPVVPLPQPDAGPSANPPPAADPAVSPPPPPRVPVVAVSVGPQRVLLPPPLHREHYNLRYSFPDVSSVDSASGESFGPRKKPKVTHPGVASGVGPVPPPCPGRIRHFKI